MSVSKTVVAGFIGVVFLLTVFGCSAANSKKEEKQMESFLPFLFMMGGGAPIHTPAVWMIGIFALLAVTILRLDRLNMSSNNS